MWAVTAALAWVDKMMSKIFAQDLFSLAAIAAFIWLIYQAYAEIAKLK